MEKKYTFNVRKKSEYSAVWFAEMFEWGGIVRRYDFNSQEEAEEAVERWEKEVKK